MDLKELGWYQRDIASALGVSEESVSRWLACSRQFGPDALLARLRQAIRQSFRLPQKCLIPEFLWHGPEAYGFRGEVWTCARVCVAKLIDANSADPAQLP